MLTPPEQKTSVTLASLLQGKSLAHGLEEVEGRVRRQPDIIEHRLLCFDLLCLLGEWQRALGQLQMCVRLEPDRMPEAYLYKDLVEGELFRRDVLAGKRLPVLTPDTSAWLHDQLKALVLQARNDVAGADALREQALEQALEVAGQVDVFITTEMGTTNATHNFQWISDSDTRIGPALEVYVVGQYRWIPFSAIERICLAGPQVPRDLLWLPARINFCATQTQPAQELAAFLPARYAGSEHASDAARLGQESRWETIGRTCVMGIGQKVWGTDQGDISLYDVREIRFATGALV